MTAKTATVLIGGEAGQGLVTVGQLLSKALVRAGWHICVTQGYQSRVRGGHNTWAIRFGAGEIGAPDETVDLLVALDQETVELHKGALTPQALLIADETLDRARACPGCASPTRSSPPPSTPMSRRSGSPARCSACPRS